MFGVDALQRLLTCSAVRVESMHFSNREPSGLIQPGLWSSAHYLQGDGSRLVKLNQSKALKVQLT